MKVPVDVAFNRQDFLNKYVAMVRADVVQELDQKVQQHRVEVAVDPQERYEYWTEELQKHFAKKPRLFGLGAWHKRQTEIEQNLTYYRTLKRRLPEVEVQAKAA